MEEEQLVNNSCVTTQSNHSNVVFWDVDTQKDFMISTGALFVKDSPSIIEKLGAITNFAVYHRIARAGSVDWHDGTELEMAVNGGPFSLHCMQWTEGAQKIPETLYTGYILRFRDDFIPMMPDFPLGTPRSITLNIFEDECSFPIYFGKQDYDVFSEAETLQPFLETIKGKTVVLYGVATDYCVRATALGFRQRNFDVIVVQDAIMGIAAETVKQSLIEMRTAGVQFIDWLDVINWLMSSSTIDE